MGMEKSAGWGYPVFIPEERHAGKVEGLVEIRNGLSVNTEFLKGIP
jgi:hypothetical protein